MEGTTISRERMKPGTNRSIRRSRAKPLAVVITLLLLVTTMFAYIPIVERSCLTGPLFPIEETSVAYGDVQLSLTYYSRTNGTKIPVSEGDKIAGDHVILNASWTPVVSVADSSIVVTAPAIPSSVSNHSVSPSVEVDTRYLGNNATCIINATILLTNGSSFTRLVEDVFIGNFFVPHLAVLTPNGGEDWTGANNITWSATDLNSDEALTFDVYISPNIGKSYELLASSINKTWLEWDSTGYSRLKTYLVKVCATDGIYLSCDESDLNFTAGDVPTTTTTSTTTTSTTTTTTNTTTTTTTTENGRVVIFLALFIISAILMAIVVYYAARKWL